MDPTPLNSSTTTETFTEVLTEFRYRIELIAKAQNIIERAQKLNELGEFCYTNVELMLNYAFVRRVLFREFLFFFEALNTSSDAIPLDLRDQLNRIYGMLLEVRRCLENDTRCQF